MSAMTEAEIADWCKRSLSEILNVPIGKIDPHVKFTRMGLDSACRVYFLVELEGRMRIELNPEIIFDYPTIALLAKHLSELTPRAGFA